MDCSDPILEQSSIMIALILNYGPHCQNCLWVFGIVRQTVAQELKRLVVFSQTNVKKADSCQYFGVFRRKFESFKIDLDRALIVGLDLKEAAKFNVRIFMFMDQVGL